MSQEVSDNLIRAIENNEMYLVYQPIKDRRSKILAYEALMRWKSETLGSVSPLDMIASFEKSSLVERLNDWFFHHLMLDLYKVNELQTNKISINLSFKQLEDGSLEKNIQNLAKVVPFGNMMFEITESTIMHNFDKVLLNMQKMVDKGVAFSLDNFGTGFSSFKILKKLPLKYIKIDKEFVGEVDISHVDMAIVKATKEMSKAMGFEIIAEGVENESQLTILEALGIYYFQGYYFSKPKAAGEF